MMTFIVSKILPLLKCLYLKTAAALITNIVINQKPKTKKKAFYFV